MGYEAVATKTEQTTTPYANGNINVLLYRVTCQKVTRLHILW